MIDGKVVRKREVIRNQGSKRTEIKKIDGHVKEMKTKKAVGKLKRKRENRKTVPIIDCLIDGLVREKMLRKGERRKRKEREKA